MAEYIEDEYVMEGLDIPPERPLEMFPLTDKVWQKWWAVLQREEAPTLAVRKLMATELLTLAMPEKKKKERGRPPLTELEEMRKKSRAILVGKWVRDEQRAGSSQYLAIEKVVEKYQARTRAEEKGTYVKLSVEGIKHLLKGN